VRSRIEITVEDGVADGELFAPDGAGPWPGVILFPDAGGVRPATAQMAARLARLGHLVLLPDVYHRLPPFAPFDFATVFDDPSERDRLIAQARSLDGAALLRDVAAMRAALVARPEVASEEIGCVGYCMGGRHAILAAITYPEHVVAAAAIHASGLVTEAPDSPHRRIGAARAALYVGVADRDRGFTPEQQSALCLALAGRGAQYAIELYPGASHGFAMPDASVYHRAAAERHWARLASWFGETLGPR
jgi:carboxymethylenebutenolidase